MPVMWVLSHITLKSKIYLLNYSGIWYTARHPHITEKNIEAMHPPAKNPAGAPGSIALAQVYVSASVISASWYRPIIVRRSHVLPLFSTLTPRSQTLIS